MRCALAVRPVSSRRSGRCPMFCPILPAKRSLTLCSQTGLSAHYNAFRLRDRERSFTWQWGRTEGELTFEAAHERSYECWTSVYKRLQAFGEEISTVAGWPVEDTRGRAVDMSRRSVQTRAQPISNNILFISKSLALDERIRPGRGREKVIFCLSPVAFLTLPRSLAAGARRSIHSCI